METLKLRKSWNLCKTHLLPAEEKPLILFLFLLLFIFLQARFSAHLLQVEFSRETEEDGTRSVKHNKRILFQRMAPYPQRKVITFNRYTDDFAFEINYGNLSFLGEEDLGYEARVSLWLSAWLGGFNALL